MGAQPGSINNSAGDELQDEQHGPQRLRALPAGSRVLIFGDSWAEDNLQSEGIFAGVQGWPIHLAGLLQLPIAGNFARGQSESSSLRKQLEVATQALGGELPWSQFIVVLHSGGNDFIGAEKDYNPFAQDNFWLAHCTWGFQKKAREVLGNLRTFLEALRCLGCRRFLVSDLPFTSAIPALAVAQLARVNKRGHLVNGNLGEMLHDFRASHGTDKGDLDVVRVPEVEVVNSLVVAAGRSARSLFLRDHFHPTQDTHHKLAQAIACRLSVAEPPGAATAQSGDGQ